MFQAARAVGLAGAVLVAGAASVPAPPDAKADLVRDEAVARAACAGACHAFPAPDVLPLAAWRASIEKMALIREDKDIPAWGSGVSGVALPADMQAALRFYEARAPEALPSPEPWPAPPSDARFVRRSMPFAEAMTTEPAVANVRLVDLEGDPRLELLAVDMRQGVVLLGRPYEPDAGFVALAQVPHPSHVEVVDLDKDGTRDLLVADLGGFMPSDHTRGAVVWLRGQPGGGYVNYSLDGFPRVADAQAADLDGDGRLDVVAAAFGWRRVGELALLENRGFTSGRPDFARRQIDARPGALHVVPTDLDADGRLDLVALIAQQHEQVMAYLNAGPGKAFRAELIYAAPHPNWGSSGIQVVDLDRDGDPDVLMTNGDMFDDRLLKPYHGIQWLENRGRRPYTAHLLAHLPGVHRAAAADLDGDGDLDVVASAFTAGSLGGAEAKLPSLVWLEQVRRGRFERRTLEVANPTHATLDVGDVDQDGDVDIVTGVFRMGQPSKSWVDVWENAGQRR